MLTFLTLTNGFQPGMFATFVTAFSKQTSLKPDYVSKSTCTGVLSQHKTHRGRFPHRFCKRLQMDKRKWLCDAVTLTHEATNATRMNGLLRLVGSLRAQPVLEEDLWFVQKCNSKHHELEYSGPLKSPNNFQMFICQSPSQDWHISLLTTPCIIFSVYVNNGNNFFFFLGGASK